MAGRLWARLRQTGALTGLAQQGQQSLLVDRRAVRHAQFVLARADAIVARERVK